MSTYQSKTDPIHSMSLSCHSLFAHLIFEHALSGSASANNDKPEMPIFEKRRVPFFFVRNLSDSECNTNA